MLQGLVTERDLVEAEACFPGIWRFYRELHEKPRTFLELAWRFVALETGSPGPACRVAVACERAGEASPRGHAR